MRSLTEAASRPAPGSLPRDGRVKQPVQPSIRHGGRALSLLEVRRVR